jgi:hypothetical protein
MIREMITKGHVPGQRRTRSKHHLVTGEKTIDDETGIL